MKSFLRAGKPAASAAGAPTEQFSLPAGAGRAADGAAMGPPDPGATQSGAGGATGELGPANTRAAHPGAGGTATGLGPGSVGVAHTGAGGAATGLGPASVGAASPGGAGAATGPVPAAAGVTSPGDGIQQGGDTGGTPGAPRPQANPALTPPAQDIPGTGGAETQDAPRPPQGAQSGPKAWWRAGKAVWVLALVAVVALGAGFGIGQLIKSPAEIAAETAVPPDGLITAKIEARAITSTVVARAEVVFEDPVQVNPVIPEGMTAAVVTGQVPEIGAEVNAGDVILEVSGRPVFVLAGEFPAYRSMGPGSSGRDVLQLRAALSALGFGVGDAEAQAYDAALAEAVRALYQKAGYAPPGSEDQALAQAVRDAKDGVTDATEQRTQAAKDLNRARNDVANAPDEESKAAAEQAVEAATSSYAASERAVTRSVEALADAERAAWTTMPVGEAVFVADLPRRVDQVGVDVGSDLAKMGGEPDPMSGNAGTPTAAVVLSGAEITVTAQVNASEAGLLKVGGPAVLTVDGNEVAGEIAEICPEAAEAVPGEGSAAGAATCAVAITVADLGGADPAAVVGNVLTTMVVGTSSEDSLVVPLAAVSADTAGNARIEIVEGPLAKDQPAAEQKTRTVNIVAGLTAEGMVEIKEADFQLKAGDLVVVGQAGAAAPGGADVDKEAPDAAG